MSTPITEMQHSAWGDAYGDPTDNVNVYVRYMTSCWVIVGTEFDSLNVEWSMTISGGGNSVSETGSNNYTSSTYTSFYDSGSWFNFYLPSFTGNSGTISFNGWIRWTKKGGSEGGESSTIWVKGATSTITLPDRGRCYISVNTSWDGIGPTKGGSYCTASGSGEYYYGQSVYISCDPGEGYYFWYWSDGGSQSHYITAYGGTYTAYFNQVGCTLTVSDGGHGHGSVSPTYKECDYWDDVSISATSYQGYMFLKWNNDSTDNPYSFTMRGDRSFIAIWRLHDTNHIYYNGDWKQGLIYIYYNNDWHVGIPWVYYNSEWKKHPAGIAEYEG